MVSVNGDSGRSDVIRCGGGGDKLIRFTFP